MNYIVECCYYTANTPLILYYYIMRTDPKK